VPHFGKSAATAVLTMLVKWSSRVSNFVAERDGAAIVEIVREEQSFNDKGRWDVSEQNATMMRKGYEDFAQGNIPAVWQSGRGQHLRSALPWTNQVWPKSLTWIKVRILGSFTTAWGFWAHTGDLHAASPHREGMNMGNIQNLDVQIPHELIQYWGWFLAFGIALLLLTVMSAYDPKRTFEEFQPNHFQ
jgi:hypothetical protein